ncbi:L,D-transpeptidase family protein [Qipengyuania sp. JC766]|uniref:L,D-transpeptidase family protein n=1 Tax=Qipengyuania sp. JC766 TaxID=3232139 RepID=UPI0034587C20
MRRGGRLSWLLPLALAAGCSPVPREAVAPQAADAPLTQTADFLLVDKSDRTLTLFREGRALRTYRDIAFGDAPQGHKQFEGDERTPEGRYTIDTRNPNSAYHLSLRISYPDARDRAFAQSVGRSPGGDIFIHGQPNGSPLDRISGDWTDGCIAVTNAEIEEMWSAVPDGTPIEIRP